MISKKLNKELYNFYLFSIGQFVSQFGSKLTSYGLVLWSYKQTGSVLSMSLLSVCYLVPEVLFNFIAGSISDHWDKKKIMLAADFIAGMFSLGVLGMLITGSLRLEYLYLINFMLGIMDAFQTPASDVAISAIVSQEHYMRTSGIRSFFNSFTGVFAPVVTTSLYALFGLKVIVTIDLATFLFAFITLAVWVKIPHTIRKEEKVNLWQQRWFGIKYLYEKKDIFSLILFMWFVNLIASVYNTNLTPMVLSRNGNNDIQLGIVTSTISIAGLVGSFFVTKVKPTAKRVPMMLNIMTFSFIICNGLLAIGRNYYVWTFAVFAGNLLIPVLVANVEYFMRTKVPFELQGRIFSARNTLQYTSIPLGAVLGGWLADDFFIPYMNKESFLQDFFRLLVGRSAGSGIAVLFLVIAVAGTAGCFVFRKSKHLAALDGE